MYAKVWRNATSSSKKGAFQAVYPQAKPAWHKIKLHALRHFVMCIRRSMDSKGRFTLACRAHAVPLPCRVAKGLECLPHFIYTVRPCLIHTCHSLLWPCRSSQGHGTARLSTDGLWATCLRSASSAYHVEFHEDCYQKQTNPPHNDPYLRL
jgi:hypothetical protein